MCVIYKVYDSYNYSKKSRFTYLSTCIISNIYRAKFCKTLKKAPAVQSFFSKVVDRPERCRPPGPKKNMEKNNCRKGNYSASHIGKGRSYLPFFGNRIKVL